MFALFSTEPGEHLERYSVFRFNGIHVEHVPINERVYIEENQSSFESFRIPIGTNNGILLARYWHTSWDIVINGESIPVYDFIDKHLIFPDVNRVACEYDYKEWCNYRIQDQKIMYSSTARTYGYDNNYPTGHGIVPPVVERVPAAVVEPIIPNKKVIPTFVAEALIKVAKDAGADCPISIMPFKDCRKISVTNCYHCFETKSLEEWYKKKRECPVCKTEIASVVTV